MLFRADDLQGISQGLPLSSKYFGGFRAQCAMHHIRQLLITVVCYCVVIARVGFIVKDHVLRYLLYYKSDVRIRAQLGLNITQFYICYKLKSKCFKDIKYFITRVNFLVVVI